ncbi:S8/S53 family peptidase [Shewanella sp. DW31]|uniref:S8 family peptidase n=1 Tax=Shewanella sp. DW31 TaxID=2699422 RepID=UPI0018E3F476|nr:S8/S53 family peptidase [Shewanella sp. DW31]MBI1675790.1 S8/S53 family peptidase [Shewanella sp. DW31]
MNNVIKVLLLFFCFFPVVALAKVESISFMNFSVSVDFHLQKNGLYKLRGSSFEVQFAPRLIVKTARAVTAAELAVLIPNATEITDVFLLTETRYFLIAFAREEESFAALRKLQALPSILLVQPDLQQKRATAEFVDTEFAGAPILAVGLPVYLERAQQESVWPSNGGAGVTVAVIDDGFMLRHSEFAHLNTSIYYDFAARELMQISDEKKKQVSAKHGTKVLGILFGEHNQHEPEGLVPNAKFVGISQVDTWTSNTLRAFYIAYLAKADVINCSWHSEWLMEPVQDVVDELAGYGREGKGIAVVFAAGNQSKLITSGMHEASIGSAIVVGASNAKGKPLIFSNYGPAVDIWSYGQKTISTDENGGYSYFLGSSLSSVIVSGYIALLIGADQSLNLTQIQHKLTQILE